MTNETSSQLLSTFPWKANPRIPKKYLSKHSSPPLTPEAATWLKDKGGNAFLNFLAKAAIEQGLDPWEEWPLLKTSTNADVAINLCALTGEIDKLAQRITILLHNQRDLTTRVSLLSGLLEKDVRKIDFMYEQIGNQLYGYSTIDPEYRIELKQLPTQATPAQVKRIINEHLASIDAKVEVGDVFKKVF